MTTSSTEATSQASGAGSVPATSATTSDVPAFGWSGYAERVNGRFAMVGFAAVLVTCGGTSDPAPWPSPP